MNKIVVSLFLIVVSVGIAVADAPIDGREGRAEMRFMEGMMDHHQMALDMAKDCLEKAQTDAVKTICENVMAAQTPEIAQMQTWLLAWYNIEYAPQPMAEDMGGMNMGHSAHSMNNAPTSDPVMMMGMFAGFSQLDAQDYDRAWLESMIDHHDDAIHMSERLLNRLGDNGHAELKTLAKAIINAQTLEITQMEDLLVSLPG